MLTPCLVYVQRISFCSEVKMASFGDLPKTVVQDIMSRLPGDSLVELKHINSSWYFYISALINDKEFINKHFHHNKDKSSVSLVIDQSPPRAKYNNKIRFSLLTLPNNGGVKKGERCQAEELNLPPLADMYSPWQVRCHCDGILCLLKNPLDMDVMFCNPLLKEFKRLPESENARTNTRYSAIGFGYDSNAKDYKLVRVIDFPNTLAEIYTLGTNTWRNISMPEDLSKTTSSDALYLKGVCYWEVGDKDNNHMILSFDTCDEVFHMIPLPNQSTFPARSRSLALWKDSVALFNHGRLMNSSSDAFEVCVMADHCDIMKGGTPWIKFVVVTLHLENLKPLTFWNREEVLVVDKGGWICSYNIRTKRLRHTGFRGSVNNPVCFYEKSLVPLRRR